MRMFVACQEAVVSVMEVAWKSALKWCADGVPMTCPLHQAPLCQRDSCGAIAASSLLESLMSPWTTALDWFLYLSKSILVDQIIFMNKVRLCIS